MAEGLTPAGGTVLGKIVIVIEPKAKVAFDSIPEDRIQIKGDYMKLQLLFRVFAEFEKLVGGEKVLVIEPGPNYPYLDSRSLRFMIWKKLQDSKKLKVAA